jgi:hypothetical protein
MDSDGKCTFCEGKCSWEDHFNVPFYFEKEEVYLESELE